MAPRLKDVQRWVGKCNHLQLVFPANSLFTFHCRRLMPGLGDQQVALPASALEEISFWSFVDAFTEDIPFLMHQHVSLTLYTDASGYGWGLMSCCPTVLCSWRTTGLRDSSPTIYVRRRASLSFLRSNPWRRRSIGDASTSLWTIRGLSTPGMASSLVPLS